MATKKKLLALLGDVERELKAKLKTEKAKVQRTEVVYNRPTLPKNAVPFPRGTQFVREQAGHAVASGQEYEGRLMDIGADSMGRKTTVNELARDFARMPLEQLARITKAANLALKRVRARAA